MQSNLNYKIFVPKLVVAIGVCGFLYGFFSNRKTTYELKTNWFRYSVIDNIDTKVKFNDRLETAIETLTTEQTTEQSSKEQSSKEQSSKEQSTKEQSTKEQSTIDQVE